jgi:hypothetical protein
MRLSSIAPNTTRLSQAMTNHPNPSSVVKVGDGRGFIIEQRVSTAHLKKMKGAGKFQLRPFVKRRLIVTAAHCLPHLPPAHAASTHESTYPKLVGQLHGERNVWAECLFVDPIADIAILGSPDDQELSEESEAYDALTEGAPHLQIGKAKSGKGWLLALDRDRWVQTPLQVSSGL